MGFRISYIVAPTFPKELVKPLGFELGVETDALPYDEWWVGTLKSNNHTVFWAEADDFIGDVASELSMLSENNDIIAYELNEDAGRSFAVCYKDGRARWKVNMDPASEGLVATGMLPSFYAGIAETHAHQPMLIPLETAASMSGFNHETDLTNSAFTRFFRITAPTASHAVPAKKGLMARLLGR